MRAKNKLEKAVLIEMYVVNKLPVQIICRELNVSEYVLNTNLKAYGILRRSDRRFKPQMQLCSNLTLLQELSQDETLSNVDIAKRFKVSTSVLHSWFISTNIDRRVLRNNEGHTPDYNTLYDLYITQQLPPGTIAKGYNVTGLTVKNWLCKLKIPMRTNKEVRNSARYMQDYANTCLAKYGTASPFGNSHIQQTIRETNIDRYGSPFPITTPEIREKAVQTWLKKYDVPNPLYLVNHPSKGEVACISTINKQLGLNLKSSKSILPDYKELDGFDEKHMVAVEYCGVYWHAEPFKDKWYHYNKWLACRNQGIKLYTIFEDEWASKQEAILRYLYMNNNLAKKRIGARKTKLVNVDSYQARQFLAANHMQGSTPSIKLALGLEYKEELILLMTFGFHHRKTSTWVMNRLAGTYDVCVIGGASKLIQAGLNNIQTNIISWSDNRWSAGVVYEKSGGINDKLLDPDYTWTKNGKRIAKQLCRKAATGQPADLTEREFMESKGYSRIWDCGKIRWRFTK